VGGAVGTYYGGPAGGAAGAQGGQAIGSYFSDERLKENIVRAGASPSGIPIYEFTFKDDKAKRRFSGTIAQELMKTRWDAVHQHKGKLVVDYDKIDVEFKEVV
jgi:hypothetical protein